MWQNALIFAAGMMSGGAVVLLLMCALVVGSFPPEPTEG